MDKFEQEIKSAYLECKKATTKLNKKSLILGEVLTKEIPRAEIACELGKLFYMQHKFVEAIYWFEYALKQPISENEFIVLRCYDLIPIKYLYKCNKKLNKTNEMLYYKKMLHLIRPK